jgi:8-oxo-dGTP pyrophosphatase MutT (NUDIX family)
MNEIPVIPLTRLDLRYAPVPWRFAIERRVEIDAHFARAHAANPTLWNGRVLLMHQWAIEGSVLSGAYMDADFASFLAWRDFGYPDTAVFNCFPMAGLQSADGAYLLGVMGPHTANHGKIYFPAGTPEPADIVDGAIDLAGGVMRELTEETGLTADDVEVAEGWTLVEAGTRLALMKSMRVRANADDLRSRVLDHLAREERPELSDIRIVRGPADVDPELMPLWITAYFKSVWA